MKRILICFCMISLLVSCNKSVDNKEVKNQDIVQQEPVQEEIVKSVELEVILDDVRVRDAAGLNGKEVTRLPKKSTVIFEGVFSDFTDKIKLRGVQYDDPWLKIKTTKGIEGWIYGASVKFDATNNLEEDLYSQLITKRLTNFFGSKLVFQIEQYQKSYQSAKTDRELALVYRSSIRLKDKLNDKFADFFDLDNFEEDYPDLFWIDDPIPAMSLGLVAEGTMYQLFTNIKDLQEKAATTTGDADDKFTNILRAYFDDDVQYYFPMYFLQTWDYGGYSLLGQGKHKELLNRLEKLAKETDVFTPEINNLKSNIIKDIVEGTEYGENQVTIIKELDEIVNSNYTIITDNELVVLKNRRPMFEDPKKYEIQVFMKDF